MSELVPANSDRPPYRSADPVHYQGPHPAGLEFEDETDLATLLGVLRRNVLLIALVTIAVVAVAGWLVYIERPTYRAQAVIRLVDARRAMTGGIEAAAMERMSGTMTDPILSQIEVMRSRGVLGEVVDQEGLQLHVASRGVPRSLFDDARTHPSVWFDTLHVQFEVDGVTARSNAAEVSAPYGGRVVLGGVSFIVHERPVADEAMIVVVPREVAIDQLRENLSARLRERTDVVDIGYTDHDPVMAQRVVNTLIRSFQARNASDAQQESRRRRLFVGDQLEQTEAAVREAQDRLTEFRSRREVFSSREQLAAYQSGRMGIEVRREELEADRGMYQALLERLEQGGGEWTRGELQTFVASPGVAQNPVAVRLYEQLVEYQTARDTLTTGAWSRSATNPDVERLDALIASTEERLVNAVRSHIGSLEARIRALDELEARSSASFRELPAIEAEEMRLVQELDAIQRIADLLREEHQRARIAEAVEAGQVEIVDPAVLPMRPESSRRALKLALGLMLGLMLGSGSAFLVETLNTRLRGREDIEAALGLAGLTVIPRIDGGPDRIGRVTRALPAPSDNSHARRRTKAEPPRVETLVAATHTRSPAAEAFRTLRTNLLFAQAADDLRVVLVTSSAPGEGKTTTAANLAVTFAQQGLNVLLIDGDLRRPRLHHVFDLGREPGLSEMILGQSELDGTVRETRVQGLTLLTTGTLPPSPAELLGSPKMRAMMTTLRGLYDIVVIDSPPVHVAADAAVLSTLSDGVVLVVRSGQTEREAAQQAVRQLSSVGARILGTVINDPQGQAAKYGGYYSYANYYGDDD